MYSVDSAVVDRYSCDIRVCSVVCTQLEEFRSEIQRRDQEIVAMSAKMKTLEEQHTDYQRHIGVLKESLSAKEEHYTMLQADVSFTALAELTRCSYQRYATIDLGRVWRGHRSGGCPGF